MINALLERYEGRRDKPYYDTMGNLSIGVGHNLDGSHLPDKVIDLLRDLDVDEAREDLISLLEGAFQGASPCRQAALLDLRFQLGYSRFRGFKKLIAYVLQGDWADAGQELLSSHLAMELPGRTQDLVKMLRDDLPPSWWKPVLQG